RQRDQSGQRGLCARHWGNEETPPSTPREPVIAAGTRHDDGWKPWEEEHPTLDPSTGHPWQFYTLTPHEHVPLYRRGIAMAAEHDPTTGLLVSMHGAGLYNDRYGTFRLAERQFSPSEQAPCTFPRQARLLPDRPYRHAEACLAAMARAEVTVLECRASRD